MELKSATRQQRSSAGPDILQDRKHSPLSEVRCLIVDYYLTGHKHPHQESYDETPPYEYPPRTDAKPDATKILQRHHASHPTPEKGSPERQALTRQPPIKQPLSYSLASHPATTPPNPIYTPESYVSSTISTQTHPRPRVLTRHAKISAPFNTQTDVFHSQVTPTISNETVATFITASLRGTMQSVVTQG